VIGQLPLDGFRNRTDVPEYLLGRLRVADFQAKLLVQGQDELQGIDGVQT